MDLVARLAPRAAQRRSSGFICPDCKVWLLSPNDLVSHWHSAHGEAEEEPAHGRRRRASLGAPALGAGPGLGARPPSIITKALPNPRLRRQARVNAGTTVGVLLLAREYGLPREIAERISAFARGFVLADYALLRRPDDYTAGIVLKSRSSWHARRMLCWQKCPLVRGLCEPGVSRRRSLGATARSAGFSRVRVTLPLPPSADLRDPRVFDAAAIRIFDALLEFSGDVPNRKPVRKLLGVFISVKDHPALAHELFVQLIKQITRNPFEWLRGPSIVGERFLRYLRILWLTLSLVRPTPDLVPFLREALSRLRAAHMEDDATPVLEAIAVALRDPDACLLRSAPDEGETFLKTVGHDTIMLPEQLALRTAAATDGYREEDLEVIGATELDGDSPRIPQSGSSPWLASSSSDRRKSWSSMIPRGLQRATASFGLSSPRHKDRTDEEVALGEGLSPGSPGRVHTAYWLPNLAQMLVLRDFSPLVVEVELPTGLLVGTFVLPPWSQMLRARRAIGERLGLEGHSASMLGLSARWYDEDDQRADPSHSTHYLQTTEEAIPVQPTMCVMDLICMMTAELDEWDPTPGMLRHRSLRLTLRPRVFFPDLAEHRAVLRCAGHCRCRRSDASRARSIKHAGDDATQRILYLQALEDLRRGIVEPYSVTDAATVAAAVAMVDVLAARADMVEGGGLDTGAFTAMEYDDEEAAMLDAALQELPPGMRPVHTLRQWKASVRRAMRRLGGSCATCLRADVLAAVVGHPLAFSHVLQGTAASLRHLPQDGSGFRYQPERELERVLVCINHHGVTFVADGRQRVELARQDQTGEIVGAVRGFALHGEPREDRAENSLEPICTVPVERVSSWGCIGARLFLKLRAEDGSFMEHQYEHSCRYASVSITNFLTEIAYCLLSYSAVATEET